MKSPREEMKAFLTDRLPALDQPEDMENAIDAILAAGGVSLSVELVHPHVLQPDGTLNIVRMTISFDRDETTEEIAEREAVSVRRLEAFRWEPGDGPPPKGVTRAQLFEQTVWWTSQDGPIRLSDMASSHLENTYKWLQRRAEALKMRADLALIGSFPNNPSDGVADALDQIQDDMNRTSASDWLESQPLVKRMRKLIKKNAKASARRAKDAGVVAT